MSRIVIALGGNALGNDACEQIKMIHTATPTLIGLIAQGHEIIVTHGNGPQVGMINLAFEEASASNEKISRMALPECAAMSQGYIGYHLQQGIQRELRIAGMPWHCATVITQVEVDGNDPAFKNPSKPIGGFYTESQASAIMKSDPSSHFAEDAGRGWRRMVPSPKPKYIVERDSILNLLDHEFIVIACGGGGIPVVKDEFGDYHGVPAVIDKDYASGKLAELCDADYLFILTAVERVSINWGKPDQRELKEMSVEEAKGYLDDGQFPAGSMGPKVQAAIEFAKSCPGKKAVIGSLQKAPEAMRGESGTLIIDR